MKIMMVCLGNICRSPMAHGILRHKAIEHGYNITIESSGTGSWHVGEAPDRRMMAKGKEHGVDISDLRAQQFVAADFDRFDRIYVMDRSNYRDVMGMAQTGEDENKVKMILNELHPEADMPVPDPYYGGDEGFEQVYQLLDKACDVIINQLDEQG